VDDPRTYYWNLLLVHPLERALTFLTTDLGLGAGLAIIVFTILMRVVLLPLTIQQFRSQKAMQKLQPELKELQKKHGKDREKLQQETMALYKEHGVNPAAGCFPLLVQMPVLFALYAALINLATTNPAFQEPWMWIPNLAHPDVIVIAGISIPFILPILTAGTQWVQQRMMTQPTDDPQQKMQNSIMQFMPLMMLYFGTTIAAGVVLYWLTQNLAGIVQQYFQMGWGSLLPNRASTNPSAGQAGITSEGGGSGANGSGGPPGLPNPSRTGHRSGSGRRGGGGTARREERRASGKR
jgi:YidC/Oxa1 family membrane protein insertase